MITHLKHLAFTKTPWKNGLGQTSQIAIFPKDASLAANDFLWRISTAEVLNSSPFSVFPNCERKLVVWKGDGLKLNGEVLLPDLVFSFSGEKIIDCDLLNHVPVTDLGIIYKKDVIKVGLHILNISTLGPIYLERGTHFIFLAKGKNCQIDDLFLENGDGLIIDDIEKINISALGTLPLTFYHFIISA